MNFEYSRHESTFYPIQLEHESMLDLLIAWDFNLLGLGLRSGEVTPSPPSRPLSALSQQSMNSVNSGVSLRARSSTTSRRPRPFSIAVTGVSQESDSQMARSSHRHSETLCLLYLSSFILNYQSNKQKRKLKNAPNQRSIFLRFKFGVKWLLKTTWKRGFPIWMLQELKRDDS